MEPQRYRSRDLLIGGQHFARIDEHVAAILDIGLIEDARWNTEGSAAARRHRIIRVIDEIVRRFLPRLREGQRPVTARAVRVAAAMEKDVREARALERPLILVPPAVVAHHKDSNRRILEDASVDALEEMVEPSKLNRIQLDPRFGTEIYFTRAFRSRHGIWKQMRPRAHQELLRGSRALARGRIAHALVHRQRVVLKDIVP